MMHCRRQHANGPSRLRPLSGLFAVLLVSLGILGIGTSVASAQELDFELSNSSAFSAPQRLDQMNRLSGSFRWDLGPRLRVRAGGFIALSGTLESGADFFSDRPIDGDLTALLLRGEYPVSSPDSDSVGRDDPAADLDQSRALGQSAFRPGAVVGFEIGRQPASEFSGFVMDTRVDGASVSYTNAVVDAEILAGYTGLRLRNASRLNVSPSEAADSDKPFAASRGIGQVSVAFPELISRQSLLFTGIGQYDLAELPSAQAAQEGAKRYHALHLGTGVTGPLSTRLFYTVFGFYQRPWFGDAEDGGTSGNAAAAGGSLRLYLEEFAYSTLQARLGYASGAAGQDSRTALPQSGSSGGRAVFVPITDPTITPLLPVAFSNIWLAEARYSFRPFAPAYPSNTGSEVEFLVQGVGRPSEGAGTLAGLDPETPPAYLGTLAGASLQYRPTSDLNVALDAGLYWPSTAAVGAGAASADGPAFRGAVEARLRL